MQLVSTHYNLTSFANGNYTDCFLIPLIKSVLERVCHTPIEVNTFFPEIDVIVVSVVANMISRTILELLHYNHKAMYTPSASSAPTCVSFMCVASRPITQLWY